MKKIYLMATALTALTALTGCDNNADLYGDDQVGGNNGQISLTLKNDAKVRESEATRADNEANDNGEKPGVFDPAEVNVQNYELTATDNSTGKALFSGKIADLGGNNGVLTRTMPEGTYTLAAQNYDGSGVTVSERPWFRGEAVGTILPGKTTQMTVSCKLQNIQMKVALSNDFKNDFLDDYTITVDNGDGAVNVFTKDNVSKVFYYQVPDNKQSITVSVKATVKSTNTVIMRTYTVTKPADAEGDRTLKAGDAFILNITSDDSMLSHIDFGMTVDFSFAEQEFTFEIDESEITYEDNGGGEDPGPGPDEPGDNPGNIVSIGLPAEYTDPHASGQSVTVDFTVPNGFKHLYVTIRCGSESFKSIIEGMDMLETFDICNPAADKQDGTARDLTRDLNNLGLLPEDGSLTGDTQFTFNVTEFMSLLPYYGVTTHYFDIKVVDANDNVKEGTLTVHINSTL